MRRLISSILLLSASALGAVSCATYAQDLDRARRHYEANQYEHALALFRVLEDDLDSYSPAERAQYAYLRGMTDYRLAGLAPQGSGVIDPRRAFRDNARHWLGVAAAIDKETPGGINGDEKQRMNETLTDLNRDVFGGAEALPEGGPPPDGAAPPDGMAPPGGAPMPAPGAPGAPMQPATPAAPGQPAMPPAGPPPPPRPQ